MKQFFTILYMTWASVAMSQSIVFPPHFEQLLTAAGIDFFEPADAPYRDLKPHKNRLEKYDFGIVSKEEKLEIRYSIKPYKTDEFLSQNPHLLTMRAVASIATNEEDYIISALEMGQQALQNDFNADWGMTYFFTPKKEFSRLPHCRMIALYKEGKGTAFVFYLFDDANNEALDTRYFALRFLKDTVVID